MQQQIDTIESYFAENKTLYVATIKADGTPNIRPFLWIGFIDKKLYFCTGNQKNVYKEICGNPHVALSGVNSKGMSIRIFGEAKEVKDEAVKGAVFKKNPGLTKPYPDGAKDKAFALFHVSNADVLLITGEKFHIEE